jgi:acyl transferase domain-containing protein/NADPH:quinone reductase-like Zn-dependent oxidoreductase
MKRPRAVAAPAAESSTAEPSTAAMPIAIVGAACRLPGTPNMRAFWALLAEGRDAVTEIPSERFSKAAWLHPRRQEPGKTYSFAAGVLGDVLGFDHAAFGISPREAAEMDPQQRLILELVREALEDAGWREADIAGRPFGVYMGASTTDWADLRQFDPAAADRYMMTGGALSVIANRVSNIFDLRGPAQSIDTACSSGLVALHHAAEALRMGRIPAALVGGVNMLLSPFPFGGFARASMLSPTGRCHAFDSRADGYVRAEGGAVVVLKRLDDALRDGDAIQGVILASGVNAAGRTVGLSLPNQAAQAALLRGLLADTAIDPNRIRYFEAHGTGTAAGDPIEAAAIGEAVGRLRDAGPLPIGSAKSNIGHTEAASGLVGLIKALLVLRHGQIPPSLHIQTPNPNIDFQGLRLRVATRLERLPGRADAVLGVNSFGFGGTNAGILLAGPPVTAKRPARAGRLPPLLLSARSPEALAGLAGAWEEALRAAPPPRAAALIRGQIAHRDLLQHRLVVRGATPADLVARLAAWRGQGQAEGLALGSAARGQGVAFVFSGNGAQWPGMAQAATLRNPAFRAALRAVDAQLKPWLGWSVAKRLAEGVDADTLAATDHAQPLLFAVQIGLVAALAAQGIRPALVLGHSVGEVATAHVAGLLDLKAACRLIVARSRQQQAMRGQGRMAALGASAEAAAPILAACNIPGEKRLEIAAINAPSAITVAGPPAALALLDAAAKEQRWSFIPLDLDYAFHSSYMDPVRGALMADLRGMRASPGRIPMISTVTGEVLEPGQCRADYWWRNLREPVRFHAALARAARMQPRLFIEIGPNPVLLSYLRDGLRAVGSEAAYTHSLSKRDPAGDPLPAMIDRATALGADPRDAPHFQGASQRQGLPRAPLSRSAAPMPRSHERTILAEQPVDHILLGSRRSAERREWTSHIDLMLQPWLADHRLAGDAVLPAAAMLEMALAAGQARHPEAAALEVSEFHILRAIPLEAERSCELRSRLDDEGLFTLESRRRLSEEPWSLHARGRVLEVPRLPDVAEPLPAQAPHMIATERLVAMAHAAGLDYGPAFQPVAMLALDPGPQTACATLILPETAPGDAAFLLHPVRLDGAMQGMIGLLAAQGLEPGTGFVPVRATRLVVRRGAPPAASADICLVVKGERSAAADLVLRDGAGAAVAVLEGCWVQKLRLPGRGDPAQDIFRLEQVPAPAHGNVAAEFDLAAALAALEASDAGVDVSEAAMLMEGYAAAAAAEALTGRAPAAGPYAATLRALAGEDELPPREAIWRQVLLEQPILAHELAWLAEAAAHAGHAHGRLSTIPGPDAASFDIMARLLAAAVGRLAQDWPQGRPLRVLEIAAGPGPFTRLLAAALAASGRRVIFHAAALPEARAPHAPSAGVEFTTAPWDPLGGEAPPLMADIVLGILPALRLRGGIHGGDGRLLLALRHAVAPGGALLLAEALPGVLWDFALGQDPGWWEAPGLADEAQAMQALRDAGWLEVSVRRLLSVPLPVGLLAARAPLGAASLPGAMPRRLILVADAGAMPLRQALAHLLGRSGVDVAGGTLAEAASQLSPRAMQGAPLVLLLNPEANSEALGRELMLAGRLAAAAQGAASFMRLVTMGAERGPAAAAIQALGRVLSNEMPALKLRRIDLAAPLALADAARRLLAELQHGNHAEGEITLTEVGRLVPRLLPGLPPAPPPAGPLMLAVAQPGQLSSLHWAPISAPGALGEGEVMLRVEAAGLNFRDLMWAQGLLPEETLLPGFAGPGLGIECAGVVEAVGPKALWRVGDAVFGFAPHALASRVITRADALAARPEGLSPAAAAAVPVAFMTAVYALEEMARLEAGEVVLIHGGAGAVGLAALQVALNAGARVVATAGSPAKRAFLREAGAELVLDSRDPGFADRLRAAGLAGVDVALNSLAAEAMERTLGLMRPFGRFIELGKRDYAENRRVALRPLRRNVTYFAVDVDELPRARPAVAARLLASIAERLASGVFQPLPFALRPAAEAEAAFRTLQASGQIGKLVIAPPEPAPARAALDWHPGEGIAIILGGMQGFGLAAAHWLAGQGVRRFALISRRGAATPGAVAALASLGAQAQAYTCDATDALALATTLAEIRKLGPITGVVHAAAVFEDGTAAALDARRVARVLAAKLTVAENLDRLTAQDPVKLFLLFSSATVPVGSPGQAAYVAANAAMEALARRRQAQGRPACAVQWGAIADVGVLAGDAAMEAGLSRRLGTVALPAAACLAALPAILASGVAVAGVARVLWQQAGAALPILAEPIFAAMRTGLYTSAEGDGPDLRQRIQGLPDDEALGMMRDAVRGELGRILRVPAASIALDAPLPGLGLDSLGGMELRSGLERRMGSAVALSAVTEDLTAETLARRMLESLRGERPEEAALNARLAAYEPPTPANSAEAIKDAAE